MQQDELIKKRVRQYYHTEALNCAATNLKILSEIYRVELSAQVIDSAVGMHGAGNYGAQCGLVEGALLFIGIYGRRHNLPDPLIAEQCYDFAREFEEKFTSLRCEILRPGGFQADDPPHLCEQLTVDAITTSVEFVARMKNG
ncbi:C-GCAxxG-C-C family protein [Desulfosediminicola ganghwensis]|uniref:C-GCAxxG-C-C family protein n=1 Tax=Desulfosediminicola ganghwensis TaxID=2569540 RepID=UPI0010AC811D|nr:C-GCAxxG-C-C family protein [Desulfosediminicola ganghwensis]